MDRRKEALKRYVAVFGVEALLKDNLDHFC